MTEMTSYTPGAFCWADLTSADQQASKRFYQSLFDWDAFDAPIGEGDVLLADVDAWQAGRGDRAASTRADRSPRPGGCT